jgi:methyl acetate hydrolase
MQERVFGPLGMDSTGFSLTDEMRSRMATMHQKKGEGDYEPSSAELPADPEVHMGGHGLWSTVEDYMRFIRAWLRDGEGILEPATVAMAEQNHLPTGMTIKGLPGVIPALSNDAEFFPGMPKTWALTFMINDEDAATGRPAGSLAWAGLANLYYWIDRRNGVGGFWGTQILPFAEGPSVGGYLRFEKAVYDHR